MSEETKEMGLCEELWNEYEPSIRRICNRRLSSYPSEIDDVIADAYLALCNAINDNTDLYDPKAWLYGVVNNLIKMKYTEVNTNKKRYVHIDKVEHDLFYDIDFEDARLSDDNIDEIINEILNELTASERTLLILIYEKRLKFKEIALILGTSEDAAKQKHYRLKLKIKSIVKEKIKKFY